MRKLAVISLFLSVLFISIGLVLAQEFVVEENACLTGGVMEGKCNFLTTDENDWAWTCGWYIHRYYTGEFTRDEVIDPCRALIPLAPTSVPVMSPTPEPTLEPTFEPSSTPTPTLEPTADPQVCGIFFVLNMRMCLLGDLLRQDEDQDGIFERSWHIASGTILGDDNNCPPATTYSYGLSFYQFNEPNFYNWLIGFGFGHFDDFCAI